MTIKLKSAIYSVACVEVLQYIVIIEEYSQGNNNHNVNFFLDGL